MMQTTTRSPEDSHANRLPAITMEQAFTMCSMMDTVVSEKEWRSYDPQHPPTDHDIKTLEATIHFAESTLFMLKYHILQYGLFMQAACECRRSVERQKAWEEGITFSIMKLPVEVRALVLGFYFPLNRVVSKVSIREEEESTWTPDPFAILRTNHALYNEGMSYLRLNIPILLSYEGSEQTSPTSPPIDDDTNKIIPYKPKDATLEFTGAVEMLSVPQDELRSTRNLTIVLSIILGRGFETRRASILEQSRRLVDSMANHHNLFRFHVCISLNFIRGCAVLFDENVDSIIKEILQVFYGLRGVKCVSIDTAVYMGYTSRGREFVTFDEDSTLLSFGHFKGVVDQAKRNIQSPKEEGDHQREAGEDVLKLPTSVRGLAEEKMVREEEKS